MAVWWGFLKLLLYTLLGASAVTSWPSFPPVSVSWLVRDLRQLLQSLTLFRLCKVSRSLVSDIPLLFLSSFQKEHLLNIYTAAVNYFTFLGKSGYKLLQYPQELLHTFIHSHLPHFIRVIKSSNILLDGKYIAKVSDSGISRTISIEQTHFSTNDQSAFGYLDSEHCHSSRFTEKLMELLTSKKLLYGDKSNERIGLTTEFLFAVENFCLRDILHSRVSKEVEKEEILIVAELARECLNVEGKKRSLMKKVELVL